MLTTPLLALLTAVPVLGEAGESCRTDADCMPSLVCVASTCAARAQPAVPVTPRPAERVLEAVASTEAITEQPPAPGTQPHFSGVHFFLGAMGGAGPMWSRGTLVFNDQPVDLAASGLLAQAEARIGVLFGRFELAGELAPGSAVGFATPYGRAHTSAALSVGWLLGLFENEGFSISLPIRVRGGAYGAGLPGGLVGASVGIGVRLGNALIEARLLGAEYRARDRNSLVSLPFNLSFSWIF